MLPETLWGQHQARLATRLAAQQKGTPQWVLPRQLLSREHLLAPILPSALEEGQPPLPAQDSPILDLLEHVLSGPGSVQQPHACYNTGAQGEQLPLPEWPLTWTCCEEKAGLHLAAEWKVASFIVSRSGIIRTWTLISTCKLGATQRVTQAWRTKARRAVVSPQRNDKRCLHTHFSRPSFLAATQVNQAEIQLPCDPGAAVPSALRGCRASKGWGRREKGRSLEGLEDGHLSQNWVLPLSHHGVSDTR